MSKIKLLVEIDEGLYDEVKGKDVHYSKSLQAIAEGKPYDDSGDLISREALKEQINATDFDFGDYYDNTEEIRKRVCETIDNAPTVNIEDEIAGAYNEGYMCGSREAEKARPQGEWKCTVHSTYRGYYKDGEPVWGSSKVYSCPVCGRRTIVKENFCPSCGTDMREIPLSERIRKFKQEDLKKEVTG